jgi:hypothetical protein
MEGVYGRLLEVSRQAFRQSPLTLHAPARLSVDRAVSR